MKNWPKKIEIFEVGPRDGLQNEKKILTLEAKVEFICNLIDAGFKQIPGNEFLTGDFEFYYGKQNKYNKLSQILIYKMFYSK